MAIGRRLCASSPRSQHIAAIIIHKIHHRQRNRNATSSLLLHGATFSSIFRDNIGTGSGKNLKIHNRETICWEIAPLMRTARGRFAPRTDRQKILYTGLFCGLKSPQWENGPPNLRPLSVSFLRFVVGQITLRDNSLWFTSELSLKNNVLTNKECKR